MKVEDLVIGKEYYFDSSKRDKGIFKGVNNSGYPFFQPTNETTYLIETDSRNGFEGCVGFMYANSVKPVEP